MPDQYDDDEPDDLDESDKFRQLRQKAKRADDLAAENEALRRENALAKAGLDLSPAQQKALLAVHEGDLTPEALVKTATELKMVPEPAEPEPQVPDDDVAAQRRTQEAMAGTPADAHPETLDERLSKATSQEEVLEILRNTEGISVDAEL